MSKHTQSTFLDLLRVSNEFVQESTKLSARLRECLSTSAVIMDTSRKLLSSWPVNQNHSFVRMGADPVRSAFPSQAENLPGAPEPQPAPSVGLERVQDQSFEEVTVRLDGRHFVDCSLKGCVLEYWGGQVVLEGTHFSGCRFSFAGHAAMTLSLLQCFGLTEGDQSALASFFPPSSPRIN